MMTWQDHAACHGHPADLWFPTHTRGPAAQASINRAKAICQSCPVRRECLDHARANNEPGIWGGTTEEERGWRFYPTVSPWRPNGNDTYQPGPFLDALARHLGVDLRSRGAATRIARALGVPYNTVNRWMCGGGVHGRSVERAASLLGVPADTLLEETSR